MEPLFGRKAEVCREPFPTVKIWRCLEVLGYISLENVKCLLYLLSSKMCRYWSWPFILWCYNFICLNICMGFPGVAVVKIHLLMQETQMMWTQSLGGSPGVGDGNPLQYSCLENSICSGGWWATVRGVTESDTTEHAHARANTCK